MLQTQSAFALLLMGDWLDVGHARQVAAAVAASTVEYWSAKQFVHEAEPVDVLYLPGTHATQLPSLPVYPALQMQLVMDTLPVATAQLFDGHDVQAASVIRAVIVLYLPAPQSVHVADPVADFHFPVLHALHGLPSTPVYPVLHVHAPTALLPCPDTVFDGQPWHTAAAVAAAAVA